MEICRIERPARPGWSEGEETLLFERAKKARERGQPLKSVFDDVATEGASMPIVVIAGLVQIRDSNGPDPMVDTPSISAPNSKESASHLER